MVIKSESLRGFSFRVCVVKLMFPLYLLNLSRQNTKKKKKKKHTELLLRGITIFNELIKKKKNE